MGKPPCPQPHRVPFQGRWARLEPIGQAHVTDLWAACKDAAHSFSHTRYGPYDSVAALTNQITDLATRPHQPFWAVLPQHSGRAEGWLSLCDIDPQNAAIEIGAIWFAPTLQRTQAGTEAVFLLMQHAFDTLGYNRLVWRCIAENLPSRRAAARYGFEPEGIWRAGGWLDGAPRDLVWHSILAVEWPLIRDRIATWLQPRNFDAQGRALRPLNPEAVT